ncbi:MAG: Arc family DNA-binding protein [Deltaproteobacteria bacterium]|nr:Arc family DNA-binding protein [Deltaproteobacteria bacterium]
MATIHARNVPDHLYDWLKKSAKSNDRSIAAEVVRIVQEAREQSAERERIRKALARIRANVLKEIRPVGMPNAVDLLREDRDR